jgi:hypothetical protein
MSAGERAAAKVARRLFWRSRAKSFDGGGSDPISDQP